METSMTKKPVNADTTLEKAPESIQVRADPEWIARLKVAAKRMGLSVSAYVRSTMTREMDRTARRDPGGF